MAKSQTVSNHIKSRLVTATIIIWGLAISAIVAISIEYYFTRHSILLLPVALLVGICAVNLSMFTFSLPLIDCLDPLEFWIKDTAQSEGIKSIPVPPSMKKTIEPLFKACNALADRLKGNSNRRVLFMERLSHDMRSSLASIQGYAEVLGDSSAGVDGASLQTYGKIIASQSYRLGKMIDDAQTATCISENRLYLEFEPIRPGALLAAIIAETRKNNVRDIIYQDDLGDCLIEGDTFRLREMMSKIIDNALSFSNSNISIHSRVENDQAPGRIEIIVEDHGNGFSEAELTALFHPFEPAKDHKTLPILRNSLSFYIIEAIVDGHHGKLTIQSQPGQGTTFTVSLPVQKVEQ